MIKLIEKQCWHFQSSLFKCLLRVKNRENHYLSLLNCLFQENANNSTRYQPILILFLLGQSYFQIAQIVRFLLSLKHYCAIYREKFDFESWLLPLLFFLLTIFSMSICGHNFRAIFTQMTGKCSFDSFDREKQWFTKVISLFYIYIILYVWSSWMGLGQVVSYRKLSLSL